MAAEPLVVCSNMSKIAPHSNRVTSHRVSSRLPAPASSVGGTILDQQFYYGERRAQQKDDHG